MASYRRLTADDRCQIYALNKQGCPQQQIAEHLGFSQETISRELRRDCGGRSYRFKQAQEKGHGLLYSKAQIDWA